MNRHSASGNYSHRGFSSSMGRSGGYRFFGLVLLVLLLAACSGAFKNPDDIEADRVELEHSLAQLFGASGIAFSPDGNRLALGSRDVIRVYDAATQKLTRMLDKTVASHFGGKKSLVFLDNHTIAVGAEGAIYLWDLNEDTIRARIKMSSRLHTPRALAWSQDSRLLAWSVDSPATAVNVLPVHGNTTGVQRPVPGIQGVPADIALSRDGRYLAATGDGPGVFIYQVDSGEMEGELPTEGFASNLQRFGENRLLVSGDKIALWTFLAEKDALDFDNADLQEQVDGQVITRVAGAIALGTLTVFTTVTLGMLGAFSGDPGAAAGIGSDLGSLTYDVATLPIETEQQPWCGRSTAVSPDGNWLVDIYPGITREVIQVFDMHGGEMVKKLNPRGEYSCAALFSPDSKLLVVTSDKVARIYRLADWTYRDIPFKSD